MITKKTNFILKIISLVVILSIIIFYVIYTQSTVQEKYEGNEIMEITESGLPIHQAENVIELQEIEIAPEKLSDVKRKN